MEKFEWKIYNDVFYFKYKEVVTSVEEARQLMAFVQQKLADPKITKFLNDNSDIKTIATPEVNEVWGELMAWVGKNVEKNATVAPIMALKMQINRLSREAGTIDKIKAFTSVKEAMEFLDVPDMKL